MWDFCLVRFIFGSSKNWPFLDPVLTFFIKHGWLTSVGFSFFVFYHCYDFDLNVNRDQESSRPDVPEIRFPNTIFQTSK